MARDRAGTAAARGLLPPLLLLLVLAGSLPLALATAYTVTSNAGSCALNSPTCTLRLAIQTAGSTPSGGPHTIVMGSGMVSTPTITLGSAMTLTTSGSVSPITINGTLADGSRIKLTASSSLTLTVSPSNAQRAYAILNVETNNVGFTVTAGTFSLSNCIIKNSQRSGSNGGGISAGAGTTLEVTASKFEGCSAANGGAIYFAGSTLTLTRVWFVNNAATTNGGGVYATTGAVSATRCLWQGNTAANGGAIFASATTSSTIKNSAIVGNTASTNGGGIFASDARLGMHSVTLLDNSASTGPALQYSQADGATGYIANSVLWGSAASAINGDATNLQLTHTLWNGGSDSTCGGTVTFCSANTLNADPKLSPVTVPQPDAGPNTFWEPASDSPAINSGSNAAFGSVTGDSVDMRGNVRAFSCAADRGSIETTVADRPPSATAPAAFSVNEDTTLTVAAAQGLLANATDPDTCDTLTAVLVSQASSGTVAIQANGGFEYVPAANFNGVDSFTYNVLDGTNTVGPITATINVAPVDDAPTVSARSYTTTEDTPLTTTAANNLASGLSDIDGGLYTFEVTSNPTKGALSGFAAATGDFTYTPNANANGADSFTFIAKSGATVVAGPATASITITSVNDAPVAADLTFNATEDAPLAVAAPGLLANASDVDGGPAPTVVTTPAVAPAHGAVTLYANGSFVYVPNGDFTGEDSFTYQVVDANGTSSATATIFVGVAGVNDAPVAVDQAYTVAEDGTLTQLAPGVLAGATDADGAAPTKAVLVSGVAHGTLTFNDDGSFTYAPAANYFGSDSFTFQAEDGTGLKSATAAATITVTAVDDDAPTAANFAYTVAEDATLSVAAPGLLAGATDPDQKGGLEVVENSAVLSDPASGTLNVNANGGFTYAPAANFNGDASFTFKVKDARGTLQSVPATVSITVAPVNDATVVAAIPSYSTPFQTALTTTDANRLLKFVTDVDTAALTFAKVSDPANGAVSAFDPATGGFTYTPNAGFSGSDAFTFTVSDGAATVGPITVTIVVGAAPPVEAAPTVPETPTNPQPAPTTPETPSLSPLAYAAVRGKTLTVDAATGLKSGGVDAGATVSVPAGQQALAGSTLQVNAADGSFTFTPASTLASGALVTFEVSVQLPTPGVTAARSVTINVVASPTAPLVAPPVELDGVTIAWQGGSTAPAITAEFIAGVLTAPGGQAVTGAPAGVELKFVQSLPAAAGRRAAAKPKTCRAKLPSVTVPPTSGVATAKSVPCAACGRCFKRLKLAADGGRVLVAARANKFRANGRTFKAGAFSKPILVDL